MTPLARPRVAITGLGAVTPLGLTVAEFWEGLITGRSGIARITQFDASHLPCQIAGEIKGFDPRHYLDIKEARRMSRCSQLAQAAAQEAMRDAGLGETVPDPERSAVVFGTAMGGMDKFDEGVTTLRQHGYGRVNPFTPPASIANMTAHHLSRAHRTLGPLSTIVTACAAGTQAVGEATELIRRGSADLVITGGVEASIQDWAIGGFCAMRALPVSFNDQPERASRPFTLDREGFVYSEGCGVLILERWDHAVQRGARIYAEVLGQASSSDAFHVAAPDPEAAGARRAMRWALEDAGLTGEAIDYINAHGTSTPANDSGETRAIKALFGERAYAIPISSTKSMIGHPMGAAGALEAIVCALTIQHSLIPPTINYETPDPACDLDYVPNTARPAPVRTALSNSFGLGGQNACLVLRQPEASALSSS
ncbi:MAG: beta-ketoacyl-ACP synthase II [Anaerolineales bacterium]|nr:beta-ketoacyl-ACP synthase II [Anaerolineales bacterium]